METIKNDTRQVREEFNAVSTPTKVFIATLVAIGVLLGLVLGAAIGYNIAVEEVDGRDCIEYEDTLYCAD
jgi:hypothetical protein